jgi:hypothetical protein
VPGSPERGPSVAERKRKQEPATEIEVTDNVPDVVDNEPELELDPRSEETVEQERAAMEQANQEFNEFVKDLVTTLVDERLSAYDERIRDLELLLSRPSQEVVALTPDQMPSHGEGTLEVPEYRPPSERNDSDSATPWYH